MFYAADLFCGAGGASTGLVRACDALGVKLNLLAVNHWPTAVQTHLLNHPNVRHKCEAIERINPRVEVPGGRLHLLLAGPECTHHSNAAGGRPKNEQSRASAWHIAKWAQELYIDTILIENVPEFRSWGPVGVDGRPLKSKRGETFTAFLNVLKSLGYRVDVKILNAADYGDPTTLCSSLRAAASITSAGRSRRTARRAAPPCSVGASGGRPRVRLSTGRSKASLFSTARSRCGRRRSPGFSPGSRSSAVRS